MVDSIRVRLSASDAKALKAAAEQSRVSVSALVRQAVFSSDLVRPFLRAAETPRAA